MHGTIGTCPKCGRTVERTAASGWLWFHTRDGSWVCP